MVGKFNIIYEKVMKDSGLSKESSLSRIYQLISNPDCIFGIVSAFRKDLSTDIETQQKLNNERHIILKNKCLSLGYGYVEMRGAYKEEGYIGTDIFEKSLIIGKISRDQIISLGKEFNQDSVIWHGNGKFELIDCHTNEVINFSQNALDIEHKSITELNNLAKKDPEKFKSLFILGSWLMKGSKFKRDQKFNFVFECIDSPSVMRGYLEKKNSNLVWHNIINFSIYDKNITF